MQRKELEAWLGGTHSLDDQQIKDLLDEASTIEARYPDQDDAADRGLALTIARRAMEGGDHILDELATQYGAQLSAARRAEHDALVALRQLSGYAGRECAESMSDLRAILADR